MVQLIYHTTYPAHLEELLAAMKKELGVKEFEEVKI
jgi:hypothetical protein